MIKVKRFNGEEFVINCELIETIEGNPDTVITLTTGHKFVVIDNVDTVIKKIKEFKKDINASIVVRRKEV
ncbi:flagellar FlbD family protein [Tepidibacter formicigenes]|jgi:flagellar protein FlbD|uniref:Flagellar protein FlbD n=1 Tax=Tepidibacter formicigenes DSM 15518 TaxID=1123349 RepID=A0A1M6J9H6_9FIRM|nr:flagellar FlbD family protein [Tepidibacter formicigenes]SHJ43345.1 flagellar protein FlbD [Tepidibacter formicigenes DSM 15518]